MRSTCGQGGIRAVAMRSTCGQGGIRAVVMRSPCGRGGIRAAGMRSPCGPGGIRAVAMRSTCAPKGNTGGGHAFAVRAGWNTGGGHAFDVRPEGKYGRWSCVQRAPRRGNEPPAQGKRAKRSDTLGCPAPPTRRPRRGQKQRQRGCWLEVVAGSGGGTPGGGVYARDWRGLCPLVA